MSQTIVTVNCYKACCAMSLLCLQAMLVYPIITSSVWIRVLGLSVCGLCVIFASPDAPSYKFERS